MKKADILRLAASIGICQLAGVIGGLFTASSVSTWYLTLNKPWFNPPAWLFGPVWIALYALMGVALYLVWEKGPERKALILFFIQLALNILWSALFFGLQKPWLAFIEIIVLWLAILATLLSFREISRTAAYLLILYLAWVSFAAALNLALAMLN